MLRTRARQLVGGVGASGGEWLERAVGRVVHPLVDCRAAGPFGPQCAQRGRRRGAARRCGASLALRPHLRPLRLSFASDYDVGQHWLQNGVAYAQARRRGAAAVLAEEVDRYLRLCDACEAGRTRRRRRSDAAVPGGLWLHGPGLPALPRPVAHCSAAHIAATARVYRQSVLETGSRCALQPAAPAAAPSMPGTPRCARPYEGAKRAGAGAGTWPWRVDAPRLGALGAARRQPQRRRRVAGWRAASPLAPPARARRASARPRRSPSSCPTPSARRSTALGRRRRASCRRCSRRATRPPPHERGASRVKGATLDADLDRGGSNRRVGVGCGRSDSQAARGGAAPHGDGLCCCSCILWRAIGRWATAVSSA